MDQNQKLQIWNEIIQTVNQENQERTEDELTVYDVIERIKLSGGQTLSKSGARDVLERLVRNGILKKRRAYLRDYRSTCTLYSPNENT